MTQRKTNPFFSFGRILDDPGINLGVFDLFTEPLLVFDQNDQKFAYANSSFLKLTAYSLTDIKGMRIHDLFVGGMELAGEMMEWEGQILRRNRLPLSVIAYSSDLDTRGKQLAIMISPVNTHPTRLKQRQTQSFQQILQLLHLNELQEFEQILDEGIQVVIHLLNVDFACIYQADSQALVLNRIISSNAAAVLPEQLSSADFIQLGKTTSWVPGKRVMSELHRQARITNAAYLASTPLGYLPALSGLLVVGCNDEQPSDMEVTHQLLEIAGRIISEVLQHRILNQNLNNQILESNRHLAIQKSIIDSAQEGVLILDHEFRVIEINPSAEVLLGYTKEEVLGQYVENVMIGAERLMASLENASHGVPSLNLRASGLHRRNGETFPAQIQVIPNQIEEELLAILIFIKDLSEQIQSRARAQQLENRALLGEFTAIFAHEVRNPINNLSAGLQLLDSQLGDDDPNRDVVARMQNDCTRLTNLFERVLAFSRPFTPNLEAVDLRILLQRILDRWRPKMARVKVQSFFQMEPEIPRVTGDPQLLEQVFINLISNAVEAMEKDGGTLAIRISTSDAIMNRPQVEVAVSDNGPGIPDDVRERLFEPFLTTKPQGTGLGLALTKRIVTAHQGTITVNSFPGGTVFRVFLPVFEGE